jgi:hypothetical protein
MAVKKWLWGSHQQLLKSSDVYPRLASLQFSAKGK